MELQKICVAATVALALAAGLLAGVATHDVAVASGAVGSPALGWALPVIIEGGATVAALTAWNRTQRLTHELARWRAAWAERLTLATLLGLAAWVNASHATGADLRGVVLAACPPVVLLVSVELLLRSMRPPKSRSKAKAVSTKKSGPTSPSKSTSRSTSEQPVHPPVEEHTAIVSTLPERALVPIEEREDVVARLLAINPKATWTDVSVALNGLSRAPSGKALTLVRRTFELLEEQPDLDAEQVAEHLGVKVEDAARAVAAVREAVAAA